MKSLQNLLQKVIAVILAVGTVIGSTESITYADTGNITITGNFTEKFALDYDNTNFLQAEYMTPGNVYLSHIYLKNMSDRNMDIKISDIEIHSEDTEGRSASLKDELYLWIYRGEGTVISEYDECLYYGKYADGRTGYLTLQPYQTEVLSILVGLSPDAGNGYQDLTMSSKWNISAVLSENKADIPTMYPTISPTLKPSATGTPGIYPSDDPVSTSSPSESNAPAVTGTPDKPSDDGGGNGRLPTYKYIINYLDTDGTKLAPSTEGEGTSIRSRYAKAVEIPGYKPDSYEKMFWINAPKTVVNFIYTKIDEGFPVGSNIPANSSEPGYENTGNKDTDSEEPEDNTPEDINGGPAGVTEDKTDNPDDENSKINNPDSGNDGFDNEGDNPGSDNENTPDGDDAEAGLITRIFRRGGDEGNGDESNNSTPNKPVKTGADIFENSSVPLTFTVMALMFTAVCVPLAVIFRKKRNTANKKGGV